MEYSVQPAIDALSAPTSAVTGRRSRQAVPIEPNRRAIERARAIESERDLSSVTATLELLPRQRSERLNRFVNCTLGIVGLVVLAPVLFLIALAVKLTSRGPIFYTQTRVGLDRRWKRTLALHERRLQDLGGRAFTIYKFRSMTVDAEGQGGAVWATRKDPRVTPIGGMLRLLRLDELPQLINVVKGDMNIVGPRPERPSILVRLRKDIREYPLRQRVKPGLTGLAQINQCPDTCLEDVRKKVRYDLQYLRTQSLVEDLRIMAMTVPAVIMKTRGW